jgi:predicted dehydrogenase
MKRFRKASDIKVAVVGYGGAFHMGRKHLQEMKRAGMTPVAVAEVDPDRLKVAADDFPGIETYPSQRQMLRKSDVDLITLITPHNTHAKLALEALRAGRHVVCEKPLAITTAECDRMIAAARKHRRVISTYHNRHWDGCILKAVRAINSRRRPIGDVVRIEAHMGGYHRPGDWWRSSKRISGGILYDWGVHLLEYALQLIDSDIVEVAGFAKRGFWAPRTAWKDDTNEDEGFAVVRFASGQWLTLTITQIDSLSKGADRGRLEITGTKGTYAFDGGWWKMITHNRKGEPVVRRGDNPKGQGWRFYRNIADHLVDGTPLVITPEWSRRPIHVLDLAGRSAARGRAMKARYR